jgi:hypothetical protein
MTGVVKQLVDGLSRLQGDVCDSQGVEDCGQAWVLNRDVKCGGLSEALMNRVCCVNCIQSQSDRVNRSMTWRVCGNQELVVLHYVCDGIRVLLDGGASVSVLNRGNRPSECLDKVVSTGWNLLEAWACK